MKNITIPTNPINKKELKLEIIQSQGAFDVAKNEDWNQFYLISSYECEIKKERYYWYYIAKTAGVKNHITKELKFYCPKNAEELKDYDFFSCQSGKKVDDVYFISSSSIMSHHDFECLKLMTNKFSGIKNFQAAEKAVKNQSAYFEKHKKRKYHIGTSNKDIKILRKQYLLKQKKELEEANRLVDVV